MRCLVICALVLASAASLQAQSTDGTATFQFSLLSPAGQYAPEHVTAVWVTDSAGHFIETLMLQAKWYTGSPPNGRSRWLYTWNTARGSTDNSSRTGDTYVDGVTSATASTYTNPLSVTWDCRDKNNNLLPDGTYHFRVEFTEAHAQGPVAIVPFVKDSTPDVYRPANLPYFTGMEVSYVPEPVAISVLILAAGGLLARRRAARRQAL